MGSRKQGATKPEIVLFSKPGCLLCDEMKAVVRRVVEDVGGELREVDVSTDPELQASYGEEIPVLFVNGRKAFKFRLTEKELRRRLQDTRMNVGRRHP